MSSTASTGGGSARALARVRQRIPLRRRPIPDWGAARARWVRLASGGTALAFQQAPWLDAWYRHCIGNAEPLIIFVTDEDRREMCSACRSMRLRDGSKRVIAFADGGLTDYNAPALTRDHISICTTVRCLWRALRRALPAADLLRFEKMPASVLDRPQPAGATPPCRAVNTDREHSACARKLGRMALGLGTHLPQGTRTLGAGVREAPGRGLPPLRSRSGRGSHLS